MKFFTILFMIVACAATGFALKGIDKTYNAANISPPVVPVKPAEPKPAEPKPEEPKPEEPKPEEPKPEEPKPSDPKPIDPKPIDPKPSDPKPEVPAVKPEVSKGPK